MKKSKHEHKTGKQDFFANKRLKICSSIISRVFSKLYLEPETVVVQRANGYWFGQAKKTTQLSKFAKNLNFFYSRTSLKTEPV